MAARAGREALHAAVAQTEEWCRVRMESGEFKEFRRTWKNSEFQFQLTKTRQKCLQMSQMH